jgi:serine O-acetyltransferase
MIDSKDKLIYYLREDFKANDKVKLSSRESLWNWFYPDHVWKFIKYLRLYEFWFNNPDKQILARFKRKYYFGLYRRCSLKLGFSIPPNVFGPGLRIPHFGTIVVHPHAKVGKNCVIQAGVNIGVNKGGVPVIGDDVYIGPGAKIFGDIKIGNNIAIGANSVVNKSFLESNLTIAGIPARIIKYEKADER